MVFNFIQRLSLNSAIRYLIEEGFTEEECIEQEHDFYDKLFIYPYVLYDENGHIVERIGLFEYGEIEPPPGDDFEIVKMEWRKL